MPTHDELNADPVGHIRQHRAELPEGAWNHWPHDKPPQHQITTGRGDDWRLLAVVHEGREKPVVTEWWARSREYVDTLLAEVDRLRAELAASEQQLSTTKAYYIRRMDRRRELLDAARDELAALRAEWATAERAVISDDDGYTWLTCQCGRLLMQVTGGDTLAEMNRRTAGHDCPLTSTETAATPEQPQPDSGAPLDATTNA